MKCEVDPSKSPDHQDFVEGKKLDLNIEEDQEAKPEDWEQIDQGRNWGWQCAKGFQQSPIDISRNTAYNPISAEVRPTIRFGLMEDSPKMKVNISDKALQLTPDGVDQIGEIVVHPSQDPKSAYSQMIKRIHVKTPSEHSIDLGHRAIELQLEGCLHLEHSLFRPGVGTKKTVPAKLMVAILVDIGGPSEFFQAIVDAIKVDEEGKNPPEGGDIEEKKISFQDLLKFNDQWEDAGQALQEGSLTVPPCTENTMWVVFLDTIRAGTEQMKAIDALFQTKPSRALQKVNRRPITQATYEARTIMDAIMKRVVKRKEEYMGVVPVVTRNHRMYPLEKVTEEENPDAEEGA